MSTLVCIGKWSTMAEVKWIKITTDIFDDEKILMIESMPSADSIIVIWLKLLTFAGKQNNDGVFLMSNRIAYTDEMLACIFRRDVNLVRLALKTFEQFGMIEIVEGVVTIPNWGKHQTLDAYEKKKIRDRERIAKKRAEQKALIAVSPDKSHDKSPDVAFSDKEEEKELDIDKENNRVKVNAVSTAVNCQQIIDLYHSICISYPKIRSISNARRKAINARLNTYSLDDFRTVFENAEASSFLKGSNDRNWSANFDWLLADKNMAKVLEGNYADRGSRKKEKLPDWFGKRELDDDEKAYISRALSVPKELGVAEQAAIQRLMAEEMSEEDQAEAEQLRRELQESFGRS